MDGWMDGWFDGWMDGRPPPELEEAGAAVGGVLLGEQQQGRGAVGGAVPLEGVRQGRLPRGGVHLHEAPGPAHEARGASRLGLRAEEGTACSDPLVQSVRRGSCVKLTKGTFPSRTLVVSAYSY